MLRGRRSHLKRLVLIIFGTTILIHFSNFGLSIWRSDVFRANTTAYSYYLNNPSFTRFLRSEVPSAPEKQYNFSIALLRYGAHPSRSGAANPQPTINLNESCGLTFNCFLYDDMNINFPYASIHNFSAIIAWGAGHGRFLSLYKEVGGLSARPREQIWISTALESGINSGNGNHMQGAEHLFNWTAASGRNVTFQFDNFIIERRKEKKSLKEVENDVKQHLANRTHFACWAMNNCVFTFTNRLKLGRDLVKHLPEKLQLFGKSGSQCMKGLDEYVVYNGPTPHTISHVRRGIRKKIDNCMFYLSLENSNCTDYVTEKYSNPLMSYAIPIVNGYKETYEKRLPGSYIYYHDFPSPKHLSEYMQYLRSNWTALMEYHKWRQFYTVEDMEEGQYKLYCDICKKLRAEKDSGFRKSYIIPHVPTFYRQMQTCSRS